TLSSPISSAPSPCSVGPATVLWPVGVPSAAPLQDGAESLPGVRLFVGHPVHPVPTPRTIVEAPIALCRHPARRRRPCIWHLSRQSRQRPLRPAPGGCSSQPSPPRPSSPASSSSLTASSSLVCSSAVTSSAATPTSRLSICLLASPPPSSPT